MSNRSSLLDDYNRAMRRRLGQESLAEKLQAIRNGSGFRPAGRTFEVQHQIGEPADAAEPPPTLPIHE